MVGPPRWPLLSTPPDRPAPSSHRRARMMASEITGPVRSERVGERRRVVVRDRVGHPDRREEGESRKGGKLRAKKVEAGGGGAQRARAMDGRYEDGEESGR